MSAASYQSLCPVTSANNPTNHTLEKVMVVFLTVCLTTAVVMAQTTSPGQVISPDSWAWQNLLQIGHWILGLPRRAIGRPRLPRNPTPPGTDSRQSTLALIAPGLAPHTFELLSRDRHDFRSRRNRAPFAFSVSRVYSSTTVMNLPNAAIGNNSILGLPATIPYRSTFST